MTRRRTSIPGLLGSLLALLLVSALPLLHGPASHACASHCAVDAPQAPEVPDGSPERGAAPPCAICAAVAHTGTLAPAPGEAPLALRPEPLRVRPAAACASQASHASTVAPPRAPPRAL